MTQAAAIAIEPVAAALGGGDGQSPEPGPAGLLEAVLLACESLTPVEATEVGAVSPCHSVASVAGAWRSLRDWVAVAGSNAEALRDLALTLERVIARIDAVLSLQVDAILHHTVFQQLEAAWRGLWQMADAAGDAENVKIRAINISRRDLQRDFERAVEFDQSALFRKVYEDEFGTPGGEPFGLLVADYAFGNHPEDMDLLEQLAMVAAASFAPLVAGAGPKLLGLQDFSELALSPDLAAMVQQAEYVRWHTLRGSPDSRFLGLALPRVLMRLPYHDASAKAQPFGYVENVGGPGIAGYLWGNAAYSFAGVVIRAFSQSGWFAEMRGIHSDRTARTIEDGGGVVGNLPMASFKTDRPHAALRFPTDVCITDLQERAIAELGFIPLTVVKDTGLCAFYGNQSAHKPREAPASGGAAANSRLSTMLQYILCASRFAHYLKIMGRDMCGSFAEAENIQDRLQQWVSAFCTDDQDASPEIRAQYPLRRAEVQVQPVPRSPGVYQCRLLFEPHHQTDELVGAISLTTRLKGIAQ